MVEVNLYLRYFIYCPHISGPEGFDEPDGRISDLPEPEVTEEDDSPSCTYLILSSQEKLQVNVTPQAISVLRDVLEVNIVIGSGALQTCIWGRLCFNYISDDLSCLVLKMVDEE